MEAAVEKVAVTAGAMVAATVAERAAATAATMAAVTAVAVMGMTASTPQRPPLRMPDAKRNCARSFLR